MTTERVWPAECPAFLGAWPRLIGRQRPEVEAWHPGDESEGDATARFGVKIGLRLMLWEWMIVRAVMSLLAPNEWGIRLWTHRVVVIECTRQQGKTLMIILIVLRRLFKHRRRVVYTAQQWATVEDVFDRVVAIIDRVPSLKRRLAAPPSKKDNRGTILLKPLPGETHVVKASFGPRTQHFARGFTEIDDLILDEAYDLVPKETANLTGAQAASDNPQTIYASTPPVMSEHPNCGRFSGLVRTILKGGAPGLYGALYRAPAHIERGDPDGYRLAQPSYGVVGDDREMESHLQGAVDAGPIDLALFDADWLGRGIYPPPPTAAISVIPAQKWMDMRNPREPGDLGPVLTGPTAIVVERSPDRSRWVLIGGQRTADGRVHVEIGYASAASTDQVIEKLVTLVGAWDPLVVGVRSGRTGPSELIPEIEAAGIEVHPLNGTEVAQACGGFLTAALEGRVSHSGQSGLTAGVAAAVPKKLPSGGFVWEIVDEASHAQLLGVSLVHFLLVSFGVAEEPPARPAVSHGGGPVEIELDPWGPSDSEFDAMTATF